MLPSTEKVAPPLKARRGTIRMTQMEVCEVRDRDGRLIHEPEQDEDHGPYGEPASSSYGPVRRMPRDHFVRHGEAVDEHAQVNDHREPFEELASRLVDLRGIARPPTFSGMPEDWGEFRFRFEAVAVCSTWTRCSNASLLNSRRRS